MTKWVKHYFVLTTLLAAVSAFAMTTVADAKGDLSRRCQKLPALTFGTDDAGYAVSQKDYVLETGICYRMKIISTGKKEYALIGRKFFRNMWLRKFETGGMEIKATHLDELEYEDEATSEIFFTMIVPGKYTLSAHGLESKGTVVTFTVNK